jgi:hypothetical protein
MNEELKRRIEAAIGVNESLQRGALSPDLQARALAAFDALLTDILERSDNPASVGVEAAPVHYSGQREETIDRIRGMLGDELFMGFCLGNVLKYDDRQGLKGDRDENWAKAVWYSRMAAHVADPSKPDPRHKRQGFQGFKPDAWAARKQWPIKPHCWCGKVKRQCDHGHPDDPTDLEHFRLELVTPGEAQAWSGKDQAWETRDRVNHYRHIVPFEGTNDFMDGGDRVRPVQRIDGAWVARPWSAVHALITSGSGDE